uniref:Putative endochitinase 1 n=1 Tax=Tachinaephagus zealandicus TaxID=543383 RepID=A0A0U3SN52_9HYME|nr:putative endochitinase 1 [Tachinaephagus zealandicus]
MKILFVVIIVSMTICAGFSKGISQEQFNTIISRLGAEKPEKDVYTNFIKATADFPPEEMAMLLAQLIHESGSFRYREEIVCTTGNKCANSYKDEIGLPGKSYHGRGFIQLTWGKNYRDASRGLGLGDKLLQHPEIVASDTKIAMDSSIWYWKDKVRPMLKGDFTRFGLTTKAINGALECKGYNERAANRYKIYGTVTEVLQIQKASENGCYN